MARIITDFLDRAAERLPDKTAFLDPSGSVTFAQLRARARAIAQGLIDKRIFKQPVAIYLDKGIPCIAAMMGAAYSGNYYTVIDTQMPAARISRIMTTLQPAAVICPSQAAEQAGAFAGEAAVLDYDKLEQTAADDAAIEAATGRILSTDVLYVLFTSGSTGNPKGVVTPHRSVINYIEAAAPLFHIDETAVLLSQVPFYFVMSVVDIFGTLFAGATLHIVPKMYYSFPAMLMQYIEKHGITALYWVPSALCMVANLHAFEVADISSIRDVIFSGEVMPVRALNAWRQALPHARFVNTYGPTEITDCCSYYVVDREFPENARLPIGIALPNSELIVLDENNRRVENEGTGELCVRSTSINYGYYGDPVRTREVFVQNPLQTAYEEIIYRTGDLVAFNAYGELEYAGRKDFQIKHMGQRIEPGEIEANIGALHEILEVCCLYDEKKQQIVVFYQGDIDPDTLGRRCAEMLPAYMVPGKRIQLDAMPHNLNGKIDRAALRAQL